MKAELQSVLTYWQKTVRMVLRIYALVIQPDHSPQMKGLLATHWAAALNPVPAKTLEHHGVNKPLSLGGGWCGVIISHWCGPLQSISAQVHPVLRITTLVIVLDSRTRTPVKLAFSVTHAQTSHRQSTLRACWLLSASLQTKWFHQAG